MFAETIICLLNIWQIKIKSFPFIFYVKLKNTFLMNSSFVFWKNKTLVKIFLPSFDTINSFKNTHFMFMNNIVAVF